MPASAYRRPPGFIPGPHRTDVLYDMTAPIALSPASTPVVATEMIPISEDAWIEKTFRKALECQREGGIESRAGGLYRGVLRRDPEHYGSWINLGVLEFERGQTAEAVRCFTKAQGLRPSAPEACFNLGKALRTLGDRRSAQKYLELSYEALPGDEAVVEELGGLYVETERLAAAQALSQHSIESGAEGPAPRVLMARTLMAAGRFDEASDYLDALIKQRPNCHQAFSALAEVRYQAGDPDRAVLTARRAILIAPKTAGYHRQLGVYLGAVGDHDAARNSFARAKQLAPGMKVPVLKVEAGDAPGQAWERLKLQASLLERARSYAEKGAWKAGIAEFLALTGKYPHESVVWQELGWFYEKLDEPRRALTLYRKAAELDSQNLEVQLRMGRLELDLDRPEAVREILDGMASGSEDVTEVLELRAEYHRRVGQAKEGRLLFERALSKMPNRISALRGVGACLLEEGDPDGALEAWTRAFRAFPGDAALALDLADLLVGRGRVPDAERVLKAASERAPKAVALHVRLARMLLDEKKFAQARKAYAEMCHHCHPTRLGEGLDLLEGYLYNRDLRPARRLMRALARHRSKSATTGRLAFFEAVHAVLTKDANKFAPAFQRAWREDHQLDRHGRYLAGLFEPADLEFFQVEVKRTARIFAGEPEMLEGLMRLGDELRGSGALRSLGGAAG